MSIASTKTEHDAVEAVVERLAAKFPKLAESRVEDVVESEYRALADARIRDYIPVLIEHNARDVLDDEAIA